MGNTKLSQARNASEVHKIKSKNLRTLLEYFVRTRHLDYEKLSRHRLEDYDEDVIYLTEQLDDCHDMSGKVRNEKDKTSKLKLHSLSDNLIPMYLKKYAKEIPNAPLVIDNTAMYSILLDIQKEYNNIANIETNKEELIKEAIINLKQAKYRMANMNWFDRLFNFRVNLANHVYNIEKATNKLDELTGTINDFKNY
jgi:hypothetical protein